MAKEETCPKCGKQIPAGADPCPYCGHKRGEQYWNDIIFGAKKYAHNYYCRYPNKTIDDAKRAAIQWALNLFMSQVGKRPCKDQMKKLDNELNSPDIWIRD